MALGAALGSALSCLGFVSLRAREALLGLSPGLKYSKEEWLVTGFDAVTAIFWRGLSVLVSDHPVLEGSAWALLLLLLALVLAARSHRPALLLGVLAVSTLLLLVGSSFYRIALAGRSSPEKGPSQGFRCAQRLSANLADRAAFETCSWLVNDTPRNDQRRSDLGGLLGWLLAACLAAALAGARAAVASRRLSHSRWALVGVHALLVLLLLRDLPRAYAFGTWGLRYPQVEVQENCGDKALSAALARATHAGTCWAFDISAGAEKKAIFLRGSGCPEGLDGTFLPLGSAGGECLSNQGNERVIAHGPTP